MLTLRCQTLPVVPSLDSLCSADRIGWRSGGCVTVARVERSDAQLVAALRAGDEETFRLLVREWHASLLRVAQIFVPSRAVAEEVVQETWLRVLGAVDRFEGRSSLKTWVFRILVNTAKTRAQREGRSLPFSALSDPGAHPRGGGRRRPLPARRPRALSRATGRRRRAACPRSGCSPPRRARSSAVRSSELPPTQRAVISLRDVEGWDAEEVRNALDVSEVNQRVLLHRARARVRRALEDYLAPEDA